MKCYIGLDIGTSAIKGVLLSQSGEILATESGQFEYCLQDRAKLMKPDMFLKTCFDVIKRLAEYPDAEVAAICPSGASGNLILLDECFSPMTPIIGWQSKICESEFNTYFSCKKQEEIYRKVGWPAINSFPLAYLMWMKKNRPELIENSAMICMHIEYLNFALCGKFGISHSMGTPFYLIDQQNGEYNKELLRLLDISEEKLPAIHNKGYVLGNVTEDVAGRLKVGKNTKIVLGTFDHPSGAVGAGVFEKGDMLLSCGTSWVELFPAESREEAIQTGSLTDRFLLSGMPYCIMRSLESVSEKMAKYRTYFFGDISFADFDAYAEKSKLGCNGLSFDLSCGDYEKAEGFAKSDIARAIIESAAKLLSEHLSDIESLGVEAKRITIIGGITNSPVCIRIIAESIGREVRSINGVSAGAVGSAIVAAVGIGDFESEKICFEKMNFEEIIF